MSAANNAAPATPPKPIRRPGRHNDVSRDEFAAFYAERKDACLRAVMATGMSRDAAEEAVAEAFARAWSRWRTVRSCRSPSAWVVRTAVNANISTWRKRHREQAYAEVPDAAGPAGESVEAVDLLAAIRRLPARQRDVVVHRYLLDLDTATVAAELGIAPGTVKAHLHHALAALRAQVTTPEGTH